MDLILARNPAKYGHNPSRLPRRRLLSAAEGGRPRIFILDINGEYSAAFNIPQPEEGRQPNRIYVNGQEFSVPLWLMNAREIYDDRFRREAVSVVEQERLAKFMLNLASFPATWEAILRALVRYQFILGDPASVADKLSLRIVKRDCNAALHESAIAISEAEPRSGFRLKPAIRKIRVFGVEVLEFKVERCIDDHRPGRLR